MIHNHPLHSGRQSDHRHAVESHAPALPSRVGTRRRRSPPRTSSTAAGRRHTIRPGERSRQPSALASGARPATSCGSRRSPAETAEVYYRLMVALLPTGAWPRSWRRLLRNRAPRRRTRMAWMDALGGDPASRSAASRWSRARIRHSACRWLLRVTCDSGSSATSRTRRAGRLGRHVPSRPATRRRGRRRHLFRSSARHVNFDALIIVLSLRAPTGSPSSTGYCPALLRFDLSAIPAGASTIHAATLTLYPANSILPEAARSICIA